MKEYPILFSTEMIHAIMSNSKTQTRRVLKKQPLDILPMKVPNEWVTLETRNPNHGRVIRCRFGVPGDRLWVREKWAHDDPNCQDVRCGNRDHIWWYANEKKIIADSFSGSAHWRPSIHMPRFACRIFLEILSVRVERVQDITPEDCEAEGVGYKLNDIGWRYAFGSLWNSINEKRGFGWDVNPYVWVIEFRRLKNAEII